MIFRKNKKDKVEKAEKVITDENISDSEVKNSSEQEAKEKNNKNKKDFLEILKISPNSSLGKILYKSKEASAKRELRQVEKAAILLVFSLLVGYVVYQNVYLTIQAEYEEVNSEHNISMEERTMVETQLLKKNETKTTILKLNKKINEYKSKYPNYRTKNEILLVLNNILGADASRVNSVEVTSTVGVSKADILASITKKRLNELIENVNFFGTLDEETQPAVGAEDESAVVDTKFEFSEATFSVSSLPSMDYALSLAEKLYNSDRVIIPSTLRVSGANGGEYSIEGTLYFYAYRGSDQVEDLFK